jgi:hypothetical protein
MIIATHSAAQGAMVCSIQDTTKTSILTEASAKKMLNWLDVMQGDPPVERLAEFGVLLAKFRDKYPSLLKQAEYDRIEKLHSVFRNKFSHFTPTSWSIEIEILIPLIESAAKLIEVAMAQGQVLIHTSGNSKRKLTANLNVTRKALGTIEGDATQ